MAIASSIIAAGVAGAAGLGAAAISAKGQNKAADTVANASNSASALLNQQYNQTRADLAPFRAFGESAIGPAAALLGLNPGATQTGQQMASQPDWSGYLAANRDVANAYRGQMSDPRKAGLLQRDGINSAEDFARAHYERYGKSEGRQLPTAGGPTYLQTQPVTGSGVPTTDGGQSTIQQLLDSTYARPAFDAGIEAVQQSAYGSGRSGGGVLKELMDYGTRFGADLRQNEINNLLAAMTGGQSAATSLAGYGQNTANNQASLLLDSANSRASSYANNPWSQGLGFLSGFASEGGLDDAFQSVSDWWRNRNNPVASTFANRSFGP